MTVESDWQACRQVCLDDPSCKVATFFTYEQNCYKKFAFNDILNLSPNAQLLLMDCRKFPRTLESHFFCNKHYLIAHDWDDWTACTRPCGYGTRTRTNRVTGEILMEYCPTLPYCPGLMGAFN